MAERDQTWGPPTVILCANMASSRAATRRTPLGASNPVPHTSRDDLPKAAPLDYKDHRCRWGIELRTLLETLHQLC
ncbi:unnamed protein product [Linum trigynum]|uniref:Uncharacterized protein n=1 Tax=Linum trigynum TaxID=586398 RepID=A0AAV2FWL0_9ROSI